MNLYKILNLLDSVFMNLLWSYNFLYIKLKFQKYQEASFMRKPKINIMKKFCEIMEKKLKLLKKNPTLRFVCTKLREKNKM